MLARNTTDRRASRQTILRIVSLAQWSASHRRLLLGDAVDIATTEQYLPPRHHHYAPVAKQLLEYLTGTVILRIIERRCDDAAVDDQEVHIGARQTNLRTARLGARQRLYPCALFRRGMNGAGKGNAVYGQGSSLGVGGLLQHAQGRLAAGMVGVLRIIGPRQQHLFRLHETAEVVHVAIGLIAVEALGQPDDTLHPEMVAERLLDLVPLQVRVAVGIEQTFLSSDQGALAVHMDSPAFEDEAFGAVTRATLHAEYLVGYLIIQIPGGIQAAVQTTPGVEYPVHATQPTLAVDDEGRSGIPNPGIIAADFHYPDRRMIQLRTGIGVLRGRDSDGHRLEAGDRPGHLGKGGLRRLAGKAPVVRPLGPEHPGLTVGRPLRGHVETVGAGCAVQGVHESGLQA